MAEGAGRKKSLISRPATAADRHLSSERSSERAQALAEYGVSLAVFAAVAALVFRFIIVALGAVKAGVLTAALHTGDYF